MKFRCQVWLKYDQMGQKVQVRCDRTCMHGYINGKELPTSTHVAILGHAKVKWPGHGLGTKEQMADWKKKKNEDRETFGYPRELVL